MNAEQVRAELDYNPETGELRRRISRAQAKAGDIAGYVCKNGYRYISIGNKEHLAHRLAWLIVHGQWPVGELDHINRNRSDNRLCNLRDVSHSDNCRNTPTRRHNTSGHRGVYWHKPSGLWLVLAHLRGKQYSLGYYKDWFDAVCARKSWEAKTPIGA